MRKTLIAFIVVLLSSACGSDLDPSDIPNLSGRWGGFFTVSSCTEEPNFVNFCSALGGERALILTLMQTNEQVSGTLQLSTTQTAVNGTVGRNRSLTLSGSGLVLGDHARMTLTAWQATIDGTDSISGSLRYAITSIPPFTGSSDVIGAFVGVHR
jgi:hypothetical protein